MGFEPIVTLQNQEVIITNYNVSVRFFSIFNEIIKATN